MDNYWDYITYKPPKPEGGIDSGQALATVGTSTASGAATGAAVGGPWGAVIGGAVGLLAGAGKAGQMNDQMIAAYQQQKQFEDALNRVDNVQIALENASMVANATKQDNVQRAQDYAASAGLSTSDARRIVKEAEVASDRAYQEAIPQAIMAGKQADMQERAQIQQEYGMAQELANNASPEYSTESLSKAVQSGSYVAELMQEQQIMDALKQQMLENPDFYKEAAGMAKEIDTPVMQATEGPPVPLTTETPKASTWGFRRDKPAGNVAYGTYDNTNNDSTSYGEGLPERAASTVEESKNNRNRAYEFQGPPQPAVPTREYADIPRADTSGPYNSKKPKPYAEMPLPDLSTVPDQIYTTPEPMRPPASSYTGPDDTFDYSPDAVMKTRPYEKESEDWLLEMAEGGKL